MVFRTKMVRLKALSYSRQAILKVKYKTPFSIIIHLLSDRKISHVVVYLNSNRKTATHYSLLFHCKLCLQKYTLVSGCTTFEVVQNSLS